MNKIYVPYIKGKPAHVTINGHKLVVLSNNPKQFSRSKKYLKKDSIKEIDFKPQELEFTLANLQKEADAGIIIAPEEVSFDLLVSSLSAELPWLQ